MTGAVSGDLDRPGGLEKFRELFLTAFFEILFFEFCFVILIIDKPFPHHGSKEPQGFC